jgi:hypothetical protein
MFPILVDHDKIRFVIATPYSHHAHWHLAMSSVTALPEGLFFDLISAEEVDAVHELEVQGKPTSVFPHFPYVIVHSLGFSPEEAATIEKLR